MSWHRFATTKGVCQRFVDSPKDGPEDGSPPAPKEPLGDPAPPWRSFLPWEAFQEQGAEEAWGRWWHLRRLAEKSSRHSRARARAHSFVLPSLKASQNLVLAVNAALSLRRPLLLTGLPGSGKTTLAHVVADWLGLGPVLEWSVTPGASLADALVTYNPLARLQDLETARLETSRLETGRVQTGRPDLPSGSDTPGRTAPPVERYLRLGPVGTAFLPMHLPRVLLIDELDKGDLNLANELLHLFEEGRFPLAELQRADATALEAAAPEAGRSSPEPPEPPKPRQISTADVDDAGRPIPATIYGAEVQCHEFPLVVLTSNGEREFPPAFNRRCLRVSMPDFSRDQASLRVIVTSHWGTEPLARLDTALEVFTAASNEARAQGDDLALDQLLNLAYLLERDQVEVTEEVLQDLRTVLLQALNSEPLPPP